MKAYVKISFFDNLLECTTSLESNFSGEGQEDCFLLWKKLNLEMLSQSGWHKTGVPVAVVLSIYAKCGT